MKTALPRSSETLASAGKFFFNPTQKLVRSVRSITITRLLYCFSTLYASSFITCFYFVFFYLIGFFMTSLHSFVGYFMYYRSAHSRGIHSHTTEVTFLVCSKLVALARYFSNIFEYTSFQTAHFAIFVFFFAQYSFFLFLLGGGAKPAVEG